MEEPQKKSNEAAWWQPSIMLFAQLSGWITVPIIAAVFLGKWLDARFQTKPLLFIITVAVAFFISTFGIVREASIAIKQMEQADKKLKEQEKNEQSK